MVLNESHVHHPLQYVLMHKSSTHACCCACLQLNDELQFVKTALSKLGLIVGFKNKISSKLKLGDMKVELRYNEKVSEDDFTLFQ